MVVPTDSPRDMLEGEMGPSDRGDGEIGDLYGGGGGEHDLYGGELLGCGDDDEIFLLPLTALAMEADDLRWVPQWTKLAEKNEF